MPALLLEGRPHDQQAPVRQADVKAGQLLLPLKPAAAAAAAAESNSSA
jgi:hypothetical protein